MRRNSFDEPERLRETIASRTERTDGCWLWLGALYAGPEVGYGAIAIGGKVFTVHRVVWQLEHGPIPPRMCVCHSCDNRRCVRPDHLFLGTYGDNSADMVQKERSARGTRAAKAKLTEEDIRQIRAAYVPNRKRGLGTLNALAERFGVDRTCIYQIVRRKTWRHVA